MTEAFIVACRLFGVVGIHFKGTGWGKDKK